MAIPRALLLVASFASLGFSVTNEDIQKLDSSKISAMDFNQLTVIHQYLSPLTTSEKARVIDTGASNRIENILNFVETCYSTQQVKQVKIEQLAHEVAHEDSVVAEHAELAKVDPNVVKYVDARLRIQEGLRKSPTYYNGETRSHNPTFGILTIGFGVSSAILTIVEANDDGGAGWTRGHTLLMLLSLGVIAGGIATFDF